MSGMRDVGKKNVCAALPLGLLWRTMVAAREKRMTVTEVIVIALERLLAQNYPEIDAEGQTWIAEQMRQNAAKRKGAAK